MVRYSSTCRAWEANQIFWHEGHPPAGDSTLHLSFIRSTATSIGVTPPFSSAVVTETSGSDLLIEQSSLLVAVWKALATYVLAALGHLESSSLPGGPFHVTERYLCCSLSLSQIHSWLRHCATSREVAGSIPDGIVGIFHWHNPSGRTMALGSTQPLTEMSTRNISLGVKAAGA